MKCASMNNQECKVRPEIINIKSNEPSFYPYIVKINKCSGSCNNINGPYAKLCVLDAVKNINVKLFNLMSRTNETRHIRWHETCKYKYTDYMQVLVIINNVETKVSVDVNAKHLLTKEGVINDLFEILEILNVNVINHITLENI